MGCLLNGFSGFCDGGVVGSTAAVGVVGSAVAVKKIQKVVKANSVWLAVVEWKGDSKGEFQCFGGIEGAAADEEEKGVEFFTRCQKDQPTRRFRGIKIDRDQERKGQLCQSVKELKLLLKMFQ
ncbi:UNVERIFIED_CONTAM: hypothetical protein HDU68_009023 [Siphonaria sp. JEL0065]|nr:hypothetical protein HDU68_009023 [Siphonaria sp. JEL0065]